MSVKQYRDFRIGVIEIRQMIAQIKEDYKKDFSIYNQSSLRRRIGRYIVTNNMTTFDEFLRYIKFKNNFLEFYQDIQVENTEFLRDGSFWRGLKDTLANRLKGASKFTIWFPKVSTGEDIYSLAILLKEINLTDKVEILATDYPGLNFSKVTTGVFSFKKIAEMSQNNYNSFAGNAVFMDYFSQNEDDLTIKLKLPATTFQEFDVFHAEKEEQFDMIFFRNEMIYLNKESNEQLLQQLVNNLKPNGILCLGSMENISISIAASRLRAILKNEGLYCLI